MNIKEDFTYSQSNLQDYIDCPYKFYLKHILELPWPAILYQEALDYEMHLKMGEQFHTLIHQYGLGIPIEYLSASANHTMLSLWWNNFLSYGKTYIEEEEEKIGEAQRFYEIPLNATLGEYRISAAFDMLLLSPSGKACIFDWKTERKQTHPQRRKRLAKRIQTRLYCLMPYLVQTPTEISMLYWFANDPQNPERFDVHPDQTQKEHSYFERLLNKIQNNKESDFQKTTQEHHCLFCAYRSFCERGIQAGGIDENIDEESHYSLDQVDEFAY